PLTDLLWRISRRHVVLALLQPRVNEIGGDVGDIRIGSMVGVDRRHAELTKQRDECRRLEAVVANLDHVPQATSVEAAGQQLEKSAEVGLVELLERRELPEQRAELAAELSDAGVEKPLDRLAGLHEHAAVGDEPRSLDGEHKIWRHLARPFAER